MKDKPVIVSLLSGLIVILVIAGVSLLAKMNSLDKIYKQETSKSMALQKQIETLTQENTDLQAKASELTSRTQELKLEIEKLDKLKEKLEENLKDELINNSR